MANPYKENMDKIQALVKQITRDQMYNTRPDEEFMEDPNYGINFVVASGGEMFDNELETRLAELMTELTGEPDPETVGPPPVSSSPTEQEETDDEPDTENL